MISERFKKDRAMAASLHFDYSELAIANLTKTQQQGKKYTALLSVFPLRSPFVVVAKASLKLLGSLTAWGLTKHNKKVVRSALILKGCADKLREEIDITAVNPPRELATHIEDWLATLRSGYPARAEALQNAKKLWPNSKFTKALSQLLKSMDETAVVLESLNFLASGKYLENKIQEASFRALVKKIPVLTGDDFDDEMMALAGEALAASSARDFSSDPEWAQRMTQGPVH